MINLKKGTNLTVLFGLITIFIIIWLYFKDSYLLIIPINNNVSLSELFGIILGFSSLLFGIYKYLDLNEVKKEKDEHFKYLRTLKDTLSPDKLKVKFFDDFEVAKKVYENEGRLNKAPIGYLLKSEDISNLKLEIYDKGIEGLNIKQYEDNNFDDVFVDKVFINNLNDFRYTDFEQISVEPIDIENFSENNNTIKLDSTDTYKILYNLLKGKEVYIIEKWIFYFITN